MREIVTENFSFPFGLYCVNIERMEENLNWIRGALNITVDVTDSNPDLIIKILNDFYEYDSYGEIKQKVQSILTITYINFYILLISFLEEYFNHINILIKKNYKTEKNYAEIKKEITFDKSDKIRKIIYSLKLETFKKENIYNEIKFYKEIRNALVHRKGIIDINVINELNYLYKIKSFLNENDIIMLNQYYFEQLLDEIYLLVLQVDKILVNDYPFLKV